MSLPGNVRKQGTIHQPLLAWACCSPLTSKKPRQEEHDLIKVAMLALPWHLSTQVALLARSSCGHLMHALDMRVVPNLLRSEHIACSA
jgi:hypothetical protein